MPRVNPISIPVPSDGDSDAGYSFRMMSSHFGDEPPTGSLGGGGGGSGTIKRDFWFQADVPTSPGDADAGGLCDRSTLYYPGHRMKTTVDGQREGDDFFRDDPLIDEWSDSPWQS